jgi:hypothetical protein
MQNQIDLNKSGFNQELRQTKQINDDVQNHNDEVFSKYRKKRLSRNKWSYLPENNPKLTEDERQEFYQRRKKFR